MVIQKSISLFMVFILNTSEDTLSFMSGQGLGNTPGHVQPSCARDHPETPGDAQRTMRYQWMNSELHVYKAFTTS